MAKKAFIASIQIEMCIWAETEAEAQKIARMNFDDEISRSCLWDEDFSVKPMTYVPASYEGDSELYGTEVVTVDEALKHMKDQRISMAQKIKDLNPDIFGSKS
jgi:hypothetical protein